jgi:signal transduction histidine kinase
LKLQEGVFLELEKTMSSTRRELALQLKDILITDELPLRGYREPNWKQQSIGLGMLARVVATTPERLVDTLLGLALELCGAETSGLSMLETATGGEQLFRWTNLAGKLGSHIGGTTPRDFSPCGVCTDNASAQLFSHPEHYFTYFAEVDVPFVEALVIPVHVGGTIPGTIWILSHTEGKGFDAEDVRIMTELADFTGCALGLLQTAAALRETQLDLEGVIEARTSQLRQLSARLINLQDEQSRRIARELHDSAGQYLAALDMNLRHLMRESSSLSEEKQAYLVDSVEIVKRCSSEIRTLSYLLHPPSLDQAGLVSAISWYLKGFAQRSGLIVDFDCPKNLERFPGEVETALFRIVQQSLANIHRHSGSLTAKVRISATPDLVSVEVCDSGSGIPPETLIGMLEGTRLVGVGIAGMRERMRMMGGQFNVRSSASGTKIEASLPIPQQSVPSLIEKLSKAKAE